MPPTTPSRSAERSGLKDRRLQLTRPSETAGDAAVTYPVQATVWGSFEERGGADFSGLVAESAAVFVIWYRTDVTPRWCVEMDGRRFEIDSASDRAGRKVELELVTHEIKSLGA